MTCLKPSPRFLAARFFAIDTSVLSWKSMRGVSSLATTNSPKIIKIDSYLQMILIGMRA
jgi:hypothetical protein